MKEWQFQYPSTALTRTVKGDKVYASKFRGEADKLLYELKNQMKFNALGQLKMTRYFTDGTIITAWSIFGQDFVNIDTTLAEVVVPACVIEFINPPEKIPPMKWYAPGQETFTKIDNAWVIKDPYGNTEVEGVDYLKTYYRLNLTNCVNCSSVLSTVCETEKLASSKASECHPYTYDASKLLYLGNPVPYFQGYPDSNPPVPPDPENHLIYSFYESGQAEILKFDHDAQGTYFLWKAYTEWGAYPPTDITFSRTGLGYLLLKLFIQSGGNELCQVETIVKVDCCKKAADDRKVEIWWEDFGTCQPYIMYPGVLYDAICKMPQTIPMGGTSGLIWYACTHPYQPLYGIPEIKGSCLPLKWELTGPISFLGSSKEDDYSIFLKCGEGDCQSGASITLTDRCGSVYHVRVKPCCEEAAALSISYTSLLMSCNQQQTFTPIGGCAPYSWSITAGGGSITQAGVYTAPATNVNCLNNPTIKVTDCCGSTAQIQLAINCYSGNEAAIGFNTFDLCGDCWCAEPYGGGCLYWVYAGNFTNTIWDCGGNILTECVTNPDCLCCQGSSHDPCGGSLPDCFTAQCGCIKGQGQCPCDTLLDGRTQAMKDAGCCPLNPLTGLPY
jgi:hypothetical protein